MSALTRICLQPWNTINVGADGVVYPCCVAVEGLVIGDLKTSSVEEMIAGPQLAAIREQLLTGALNDVCEGCQNAPMGKVDELHHNLSHHLAVSASQMGRVDQLAMLDFEEDELHRVGPLKLNDVAIPSSGEVLDVYSGFSAQAYLEGRISLGEDFAIGGWIVRSDSTAPGIVFHYAAPQAGGWVGPVIEVMIGPAGNLQVATSPDGYGQVFLLGPIHIDEGRWKHVVIVKRGALMHLYLDGELVTEAETFPGRLHNPKAIARVGVNSAAARSNSFRGAIAGLFIQDKALSSLAVRQLFEQEAIVFDV